MIIDPSIYNFPLKLHPLNNHPDINRSRYIQVTVLSTQICMNKYLFFRFREIG